MRVASAVKMMLKYEGNSINGEVLSVKVRLCSEEKEI